MVQFVFESMDRQGVPSDGTIEAASLSAAAQAIRSRGHVVVSIREASTKRQPRKKVFFLKSVRQRDVAEFCRRLATMLRAGVGVVEAMETIGQVQAKGHFQRTIFKMAARIRSGFSLKEAMEEHPDVFPIIASGMVGAAEASGELPSILVRLAQHIEKRLQIRENILMALMYPCIVMLLTLSVVVIMLTWVFPRISAFLEHNQKTLPAMAKHLLDISQFAATHGTAIAFAVLLSILLVMLFSKSKSGRLMIHRNMLRLPLAGKVFRSAATQLWTRTLSDLLRSGLSLQEGLKVTGRVMTNQHFGNLIQRTRDKIIAGTSFGESLQGTSNLFDNLVCKLVIVGENSGTLEEALDEVSLFAEEDLNRRVTVLSKIFEPAVIVVVGIMVGVVFITCFQAIYAYI